ncbi:hypothetical protein MRY82_00080 [bacterium]|nr:hypothetical protein [bacterium]
MKNVTLLLILSFMFSSFALAQSCPKIEGARYISHQTIKRSQVSLLYTLTECTYAVLDGYNLAYLCDKENFNGQYRVLQSHRMNKYEQI